MSASRQSPASYQNSAYQPPSISDPKTSYAEQQTYITEDSLRTQYQAEGTANTVLSQMTTQRYQLQGAHDNVADMRQTTELARKELQIMAQKVGAKKRRLQMIIALLVVLDTFCFLRLSFCGGSFFCS